MWRESAEEGNEQGIGLFARYGYARDHVNTFEHFWSFGGQYQGIIPGRDDDVLGVGVAQGVFSNDLVKVGSRTDHETVLESYYKIQLTPWFSISPDVQWIFRSGDRADRDAFVGGFRFQVSL